MTQQRTIEEQVADIEARVTAAESDRSRIDTRITTAEGTAEAAHLRIADTEAKLRRGKFDGVQPALSREDREALEWLREERRKARAR